MTDRPILFSAPMVRAILEGRKTVTRRVIEGVPMFTPEYDRAWWPNVCRPGGAIPDRWSWWEGPPHGQSLYHTAKIPFSEGDTLWVREAWRAHTQWDGNPPRDIPPGSPVQYMADDPVSVWDSRYRHARFMPRWASRITLRVTGVTVERLQDITEEQAIAEGVYRVDPDAADIASGCSLDDFVFMAPGVKQGWGLTKADRNRDQWWPNATGAFKLLWNSINGPDAWDQNPWVAAISFERVAA